MYDFIDDFKRQVVDYEKNVRSRISMIDPSLVSWLPAVTEPVPVARSTRLAAEEILGELERSEWFQLDDREVILQNLLRACQRVNNAGYESLLREYQVLETRAFTMEKQNRVRSLGMLIQRLRCRMQALIDSSISPFPSEGALVPNPPVDTFEEEMNVIVRIALPGMSPDKTFLAVINEGTCLEISGEHPTEEKTYFRKEIPVGNFKRIIKLPYKVEEDTADASSSEGLLVVKLKKKGSTKIDIA